MGGYNITDEACSKCGKQVWINLGNFQNMNVDDVEGFTCPYCGAETHFEGVDEMYQEMEESIENVCIGKGYKTPNEAAHIN
jgi:DNA-directed RNA polymerase subunit RPC12/RpoP